MLGRWHKGLTALLPAKSVDYILPHFKDVTDGSRKLFSVTQFIANGFKCINELLQEFISEQMTSALDKLRHVGEVLRALVYIAQPFRKEGALFLNLDPAVQDDFVTILHDKLSEMITTLKSSASSAIDLSVQISQPIVLLVRLLQFDLGFRGAWTPKMKDLSGAFIKNLLNLALVCLSRDSLKYSSHSITIFI
jgi:mediator of RNA polymerase II transcription subunit 12